MNILWLCFENTSNVPHTVFESINKHTKHRCQLVQEADNYIQYPKKGTIMTSSLTSREFIDIVRNSDVIHFNDLLNDVVFPFKSKFRDGKNVELTSLFDNSQRVLVHHNGSLYRNNSLRLNAFATRHNVSMTVSTPDLLQYGKDLTWLPAPIDLTNPRYSFKPIAFDGECYISHSPTKRIIKGTDIFLSVCRQYFPEEVFPVLIEHTPHDESMRIRSTCQVHYDQFSIGAYGLSAVEGLAIGQIVIVGISDYVKKLIGKHEFINLSGDEQSFIDSIEKAMSMMTNEERRYNRAMAGRKWVERVHSDKVVINKLMKLYNESKYWVL